MATNNIIDAITISRKSGGHNELARGKSLIAARNLFTTLETPTEAAMQYTLSGPERFCVRFATVLCLFNTLNHLDEKPVSVAKLAATLGAQETLIIRNMRVLVAIGYTVEADVENHVAMPLMMAMTTLAFETAVKSIHDYAFQAFAKMPAYFRQKGHKSPVDSTGPMDLSSSPRTPGFNFSICWARTPDRSTNLVHS